MTYSNLWRGLLHLYDRDESQAIIRMVLEEEFGLSLTDIAGGGVEALPEGQERQLQDIMRRLQEGEPVQYVLGYTYFCGRKFHVEPGVLIPRPETEGLCRMIINDYSTEEGGESRGKGDLTRLMDIGTGSGCIAITLALEIPNVEVEAVDVSEKALDIAHINAEALGADNVIFHNQDILSPSPFGGVESSVGLRRSRTLSGVVSNPPYISEREKASMRSNVLDYEPPAALFVPDSDPLLFYRAIAGYAACHLSDGGRLYFEINPLFADGLETMLRERGFGDVEILNDSFGRQRFARACHHKE